jgi:hypothetical protein
LLHSGNRKGRKNSGRGRRFGELLLDLALQDESALRQFVVMRLDQERVEAAAARSACASCDWNG